MPDGSNNDGYGGNNPDYTKGTYISSFHLSKIASPAGDTLKIEYEDYIHFSFSTATDLSAASFSNVICDYPFVRMQGGNGRDINTINGMFSRIRKENDKYIVRIDCYHPAGTDNFPVKGNYTGDLHFVDLISEQ